MNNFAKFVAASAFALSGAIPAFAAHSSKMDESAQHLRAARVNPHRAMDAMAYTREEVPVDARAYAPKDTSIGIGPDFGIGSQR